MKRLYHLGLGVAVLAAACQDRPLTAPQPRGQLNAVRMVGGGEIPSTFAAAIALDTINQTITLPLFRGTGPKGERIFFILTESSDFGQAVTHGINWSPKLVNALGTKAVQRVRGVGVLDPPASDVHFSGTVTFGLQRNVVPGPSGFPLDPSTTPGSVGDANYSPLITNGDGIVWNAEQIANGTGVHGKVLSIDYDQMQVTLRLTHGFYTHHNVLYSVRMPRSPTSPRSRMPPTRRTSTRRPPPGTTIPRSRPGSRSSRS